MDESRKFASQYGIMANENQKPVIGISCGDINGIGIELILKTFADARMLELCTPIIFASNKVINFYRKAIPEINFNFQSIKEIHKVSPKQINVYNCWEEDVPINPGQLTEAGGKYAVKSLQHSGSGTERRGHSGSGDGSHSQEKCAVP